MFSGQINSELPFIPITKPGDLTGPLSNTDSNVSINTDKGSFADTLKEFIGDIDSLQKESGQLTERFLKGEPVDIHEVMIAAEKSKTSFQLLVEMRNKFLDFYREVSRMQV